MKHAWLVPLSTAACGLALLVACYALTLAGGHFTPPPGSRRRVPLVSETAAREPERSLFALLGDCAALGAAASALLFHRAVGAPAVASHAACGRRRRGAAAALPLDVAMLSALVPPRALARAATALGLAAAAACAVAASVSVAADARAHALAAKVFYLAGVAHACAYGALARVGLACRRAERAAADEARVGFLEMASGAGVVDAARSRRDGGRGDHEEARWLRVGAWLAASMVASLVLFPVLALRDVRWRALKKTADFDRVVRAGATRPSPTESRARAAARSPFPETSRSAARRSTNSATDARFLRSCSPYSTSSGWARQRSRCARARGV